MERTHYYQVIIAIIKSCTNISLKLIITSLTIHIRMMTWTIVLLNCIWIMITVRGIIIPHSPWSVNYTILVSNNHYQSLCSIHVIFIIIVYQNEVNDNNPDESLNLDSLLIQLRTHVTPKWYEFGTAIGVPEELLQQYSSYPADECLIEVLNYLLRYHQNPTWRDIAKLLHDTELHNLAESIMNVYETGAFLIAIARLQN